MKYQSDESRMANVMLVPQLMNLNEYLEMRMMTVRSFPLRFRMFIHNFVLGLR